MSLYQDILRLNTDVKKERFARDLSLILQKYGCTETISNAKSWRFVKECYLETKPVDFKKNVYRWILQNPFIDKDDKLIDEIVNSGISINEKIRRLLKLHMIKKSEIATRLAIKYQRIKLIEKSIMENAINDDVALF